MKLQLAVVGVGHLGKEHARVLASLPDVELVAVIDANRAQAEAVAARTGARAGTDHRAVIGQVQAAVVAAPTSHHHAIARDLLGHGVHLLVEKPLASCTQEARDLVETAARHDAVLQVGHIERFNPAFEELQQRPIRPRYLACERCSGFSGRSTDVGVVLDLMIHDLDLVLALVQSPVRRVEAIGAALLGGHEDLAQARVHFANGCIADLTASRAHPEPLRRMRVWGAEGYVGVDFARRQLTLMQPAEHLRRKGVDSRKLDPATAASLKAELFGRHVQTCDIDCSRRHAADQLTRELEEFVACVRSGARPRADGQAGLRALELAGQVLEQIRTHAWEGHADGPVGAHDLPAPGGWLFLPPAAQEAA